MIHVKNSFPSPPPEVCVTFMMSRKALNIASFVSFLPFFLCLAYLFLYTFSCFKNLLSCFLLPAVSAEGSFLPSLTVLFLRISSQTGQ